MLVFLDPIKYRLVSVGKVVLNLLFQVNVGPFLFLPPINAVALVYFFETFDYQYKEREPFA